MVAKRQYSAATLEKRREASRKYKKANAEQCRAYARQYYWDHREQSLETSKRWKQKNPERARFFAQRWSAENKEYRREYNAIHRTRALNAARRRNGLPEPTRPCPDLCELCGSPPNGKCTVLAVDHDHETGLFRGWLCRKCNQGLGVFGDTIQGLQRAMDYLLRTTSAGS